MSQFNKILFPTDFSASAEQALRHAIRLAGHSQTEVIVQHVVSNYFDTLWNEIFDLRELTQSLDVYLKRSMADSVSENANVTFRQVISKGRPAEEIVALADEENVDLIVMGSAGGAITGKVLRLAHQPVLAASVHNPAIAGATLGALSTVLVATDLSAYSGRVVEYALNLAQSLGARLYILHVIEMPGDLEFGGLDRMKEWATQKMIGLIPNRFAADPRVIRMVDTGPISDRIARVAEEIGADITIVGTHGYGASSREVLGTTTDALLSKASSPVLAVRL